MSVRVRYAPSPTGSPHIGNLRTAIYNWLLVRREGGQFLARLEDTDRSPERYAPETIAELEEALRFLGTMPDEGWMIGGPYAPYVQSKRLEIYQEIAEKLVAEGHAYYCYTTKEELDALRQQQQERGLPTGYDRRCRYLTAEDRARMEAEGRPRVVRLAMPLEGFTVVKDAIRGEIKYENRLQDDQVLLKSDGYPTYFLACTVDDYLMKITHILRGDDWLSSASKMFHLYHVLGWEPPTFVHLPLIVGKDKKKLSKRHGATHFAWFVEKGYLPEALVNFLVLLGWSTGEENREILTIPEIVERFGIGGLTEHPAVFDYDKLNWMNGHYIRASEPGRIIGLCLPYLRRAGLIPPAPEQQPDEPDKAFETRKESYRRDYLDYARRVIPLEQERMKVLSEVVDLVGFFFTELNYPDGYDEKGIAKWFGQPNVKAMLAKEIDAFDALPDWTIAGLEAASRQIAEELEIKFAEVVHPTRLAATGRTVGPGLYETLWAMGKERTLGRLRAVHDRI